MNLLSRLVTISSLLIVFICPTLAWSQIEVPGALVKVLDQVEAPAREAGELVALEAREGTKVAEGALLARIDDTEALFAAQRARIELEVAQRNAASGTAVRSAELALTFAQDDINRAQASNAKLPGAVSEAEMDKKQLALDQAQLALEKAKHEQEQAGLTARLKEVELSFADRAVQRRTILAPFAGVVVQVNRHRGDWVAAGDKLLRIVRVDRLKVEGLVNARVLDARAEGRSVVFQVDLAGKPGTKFAGKLVFVSPEIEPVSGQVRIIAQIENPAAILQPGQRGTLIIDSK